jgi:hypothetical protein
MQHFMFGMLLGSCLGLALAYGVPDGTVSGVRAPAPVRTHVWIKEVRGHKNGKRIKALEL